MAGGGVGLTYRDVTEPRVVHLAHVGLRSLLGGPLGLLLSVELLLLLKLQSSVLIIEDFVV